MPKKTTSVPIAIQTMIHEIRGQKVLLDSSLAVLYGVPTKALLQAVRRNASRFPSDFAFRLTQAETVEMRSQIVTSRHGGRRYLPYAFTEQGVAMMSSVLRSQQAISVNIEIMRAFVRMRQLLWNHHELSKRIEELEKKYDARFGVVFEAIRRLMEPPARPRRKIGY
jgi:hypothetical protein